MKSNKITFKKILLRDLSLNRYEKYINGILSSKKNKKDKISIIQNEIRLIGIMRENWFKYINTIGVILIMIGLFYTSDNFNKSRIMDNLSNAIQYNIDNLNEVESITLSAKKYIKTCGTSCKFNLNDLENAYSEITKTFASNIDKFEKSKKSITEKNMKHVFFTFMLCLFIILIIVIQVINCNKKDKYLSKKLYNLL